MCCLLGRLLRATSSLQHICNAQLQLQTAAVQAWKQSCKAHLKAAVPPRRRQAHAEAAAVLSWRHRPAALVVHGPGGSSATVASRSVTLPSAWKAVDWSAHAVALRLYAGTRHCWLCEEAGHSANSMRRGACQDVQAVASRHQREKLHHPVFACLPSTEPRSQRCVPERPDCAQAAVHQGPGALRRPSCCRQLHGGLPCCAPPQGAGPALPGA